ncbi:MAG: spiro-SPASM protein [Spirochaetota bacterium]
MHTLAIINAALANEYSHAPFAGGPGSYERVRKLVQELAGEGRVLVLTGAIPLPDPGLPTVSKAEWSMKTVLEESAAFASRHPEAEALLYVHADMPFLDATLCSSLLDLHHRYRSEYTFADGYPPGFAPEILSPRVLPNLAELAGRHDAPADRDGLFAVIQKDINSYDIETELSPVDLRGLRFAPLCDTKRNKEAAEGLYALGARSAADAARLLPDHPEMLRTIPAFLWIQITEHCPQACSYCPYPSIAGDPRMLKGFMPVERFERIMDEAALLCDDLVIDLSLWGEPSAHPDFPAIVATVMAHLRFTLIVETSGIGWKPGLAEDLASRWGNRVQWIVSLDDPDPSGYSALRGQGQREAAIFAERLIGISKDTVHVQAVRMRDNEDRLEAFYRGWKQKTDKVIIQKYDAFCRTLPDRTVADLSPLERLPCRHLARDMAILLDGSVPPCRHCLVAADASPETDPGRAGPRLRYDHMVANVFEDGFEKAWNATGSWYGRHCVVDYPEPCGQCDEYHTFNA